MRKLPTIFGMLMVVATLATLTATRAAAQTCGDANGNDTVTVTDGVQALRAAAGLSSSCDDGCDVDASGAITVSDGVNILRKAAGLAINEACDFTAQDANDLTNPTFSVFDAMTKIPGIVSGASAAGASDCENDGTLQVDSNESTSVASFTNCEIAGAILDGVISRASFAQGVALGFDGLEITRIKTGKSLTFSGQLGVASEQNGKRITGTLSVTGELGTFPLQFQRILLTGDGSVRQGTLTYDLSKLTTGKIASIEITFVDGDELPVRVVLRNQKVRQFLLNRVTRLLHFVL